jgi:glycosyl transferase family 25
MEKNRHIWVINLKEDTERRSIMERQLKGLDLKYEIVEAVEGETLTEEDLKIYSATQAVRRYGRELVPGEIGCALSHINIWKRMEREGISEVLVLEDDVRIGEMLIRIIDRSHLFPRDWELINFSTRASQIPFGEPICDIYRMGRFRGISLTLSAYYINLLGAKKMLTKIYPLFCPIDHLTGNDFGDNLVSYGIFPGVAAHNLAPESSRIGIRRRTGFLERKTDELKYITKIILDFFGLLPLARKVLNMPDRTGIRGRRR